MLSAVPSSARCLSRPLQRSLLSNGSSVQAPLLVRWASVPPSGCAIAPQVRWVFVPCALHLGPHGHWSSVASSAFFRFPLCRLRDFGGAVTVVVISPPVGRCVFRTTGIPSTTRQHCPPSATLLIVASSSALGRALSCCCSPCFRASEVPAFVLFAVPALLCLFRIFLRSFQAFWSISPHDVGPVLVRYSRHVAVDYLHQPVSLLPHSVAFGEALLVELVACLVFSVEASPFERPCSLLLRRLRSVWRSICLPLSVHRVGGVPPW